MGGVGTTVLANCIFYGDSGGEVVDNDMTPPALTYSCDIQGVTYCDVQGG